MNAPAKSEMETLHYLQIEPQYMWHSEAYIRGNRSALLALAAALTEAANRDAATTEVLFASDGEGYQIEILRVEAPDNYPAPFYTTEIDPHNYKAGGKEYCGKCGRPQEMPTAK